MIRKIARPMIASVYIADGADSLLNTSEHTEAAETLIKRARAILPREYARRVPRDPELVVRAVAGAKVASGASLAVGFLPRVSAATLAVLAVPTMISRHAFWETQDKAERNARRSGFLTNLALLGGLAITSVDTAGKPGLKWRANKAAEVTSKKVQQALPTRSETEKFGDSARDWFEDASDKVTEYAHRAQDYYVDHKDEWKDTATATAAAATAAAAGTAHKVSDYFQDNKDDWLAAAQDNAATARKSFVQAAAKAQERADDALATAEKKSGRAAKKARKNADKLQSRADKAIGKAQKKVGKKVDDLLNQ